jgi:putative redox protein
LNRHVRREEDVNMSVKARSITGYQVEIITGRHKFLSDEPIGIGDDADPNPYDLLLASLEARKVITVQMYARRKG